MHGVVLSLLTVYTSRYTLHKLKTLQFYGNFRRIAAELWYGTAIVLHRAQTQAQTGCSGC